MQNRHLIGTIIAAVLVIALVVILAASYFILKNYVVMGWQLFPRNRASLDLRDRAITLEEHDTLGRERRSFGAFPCPAAILTAIPRRSP